MTEDTVALIGKPDIFVPDASPLIHLSQAGALPLLHEIGGVVVIVDMVYYELTRDLEKPEARALADWVAAGQRPGSNQPVRLEQTETGRIFQVARRAEPDIRMRDGGETAIVEWLAEAVDATDRQTIVIYENGKVPSLIANRNLDIDIDVLTTHAFLQLAERRQLVKSAAAIWAQIVQAAPSANARVAGFSQRRTKPWAPTDET